MGFSCGCEFECGNILRCIVARPDPDRSSERWGMDFVYAILANRRPFRIITVVDNWSRQRPMLEAGFGCQVKWLASL